MVAPRAVVEQASKQFNELPPAVQQTIHQRVPNGEVASVSNHRQDGRIIYEIEFRDAERHPRIEVADDGTLVKYELGLARGGSADQQGNSRGGGGSDISALPLQVQKAIRSNTPRAELVNIHRAEENGRVVYEVEFAGRERNPRIRIANDGTLVE